MRPRFLICIGVFTLIGVLALLLFRSKQQASKPNLPEAGMVASATKVDDRTNAANFATGAQGAASTVPQPAIKINDREKTNEIREFMESQNQPIRFLGKVVDQNDNPLAGVEVRATVTHVVVAAPVLWGDSQDLIRLTRETDSAGRFEISGETGRGVRVDSVQKEGYEVEPDYCPHSFGTSGGSYDNPFVFRMWSTNVHEHLIAGSQKFQILPDGRAYFIDLAKGTISEARGGDLKIWIQYTNQIVRGQVYDWSAEIEVVKGGLQETNAYSMFSAPTDGYVPSFTWKNQIKGGQRGSIGERRFYLKLKNGQEYGRMVIELHAPFNNQIPGLIRIDYAVNPSGSRILR